MSRQAVYIVVPTLLVIGLFFLVLEHDHSERHIHAHVQSRSPEWSKVRAEHLKREPICQVCGYKGADLEVHHILPFHKYPELELDDANLITLCGERGRCKAHYWLGHCGEYGGWNPDVRQDADLMRGRWERSKELAK